MLPDIDGYHVCKEIRKISTVPIIMLSAKSEARDKILGLETVADDYIVKPFEVLELLVRIEKVLERAGKVRQTFTVAGLEINLLERSVRKNGEEIILKPLEFDLFAMLAKNKNIALSRERLLHGVWGVDFLGETRTVDVHIGQLRKKLNLADNIKTISKMGYRLED
jgi:DNA-binding response OmpR family regulator